MLVAKKRMPQLATPGFVSCTASKFVWAGVRQRQTFQNTLFFTTKKKLFFFHGALPLRNNNFELVHVFLFLYLKLNQLKLVSCNKKNAPASDTGIRFLYSFKVRVSGRQTASDLSKYPIFHDQKKIFFFTVRYLWEIIILNWCMFFCFYTWNWIN